MPLREEIRSHADAIAGMLLTFSEEDNPTEGKTPIE
jgi:hypothetical protein